MNSTPDTKNHCRITAGQQTLQTVLQRDVCSELWDSELGKRLPRGSRGKHPAWSGKGRPCALKSTKRKVGLPALYRNMGVPAGPLMNSWPSHLHKPRLTQECYPFVGLFHVCFLSGRYAHPFKAAAWMRRQGLTGLENRKIP